MSQEIEYTKFETFGVWQESSEKPEEQVVVSFGKSTLLLKDINESIVAQWSSLAFRLIHFLMVK